MPPPTPHSGDQVRRVARAAPLLRLSPRTARLRLTLLYACSFLVLGTAVIAITFLLASRGPTVTVSYAGPTGTLIRPPAPADLGRGM